MTVTNSRSTVVYDSKDIVNLTSLTNGPMIAAFWGDVDNRAGGEISYRETRDIRDLTMATMIISNANNNFVATSLVVATWKNVGYYDRHGEKVRSYMYGIVDYRLKGSEALWANPQSITSTGNYMNIYDQNYADRQNFEILNSF